MVPKEGWFGQPKYSTQKTKNLRCTVLAKRVPKTWLICKSMIQVILRAAKGKWKKNITSVLGSEWAQFSFSLP